MQKLLDRLDEDRIKMFWWFVCERQRIYWKREAGESRPWTKNKILHTHFFCNVYRELDRGTQYCIKNILNNNNYTLDGKVFRMMAYRLFNEPRTYEFMNKYLDYFNGREVAKMLDAKRYVHIRLFRGAWMAAPPHDMKGMTKAGVYCMSLERVFKQRVDLTKRLKALDSIEEAWHIIREAKFFGPFVALQCVLDLSYMRTFSSRWKDLDTWTYTGPGAKKGIYWLMGHNPVRSKGSKEFKKGMTDKDMIWIIQHLQINQSGYIKQYGLKFKKWEGKPLDVNNIEYSLCEFQKFMRASRGGRKKSFSPSSD